MSHEEKDYSFRQDSLEEPPRAGSHLGYQGVYPDFLSSFPSMIRPGLSDKEMKLWVELKRMYEPDPEDQMWTLTQNYMHAPVEWKLYDLSGVHHVTAKDKEILMLVEKDYPLRRGLAPLVLKVVLLCLTKRTMYHGRLVFFGDANREVNVTETFHLQTDDELYDKELKQIEADDQAIQTILLGLPEDIYAAEKKAKLFNEWERFTSNEEESIESYYHHFLKLMNDLKSNKHFPEKIASNMKFLNNLQPEWSRHKEVDELKAKRIAKTQDPLALMANSNNPYVFPAPHQDQLSFNQNYLQQPMTNPEDITDPTGRLLNRNAGNPAGYNDVIGNQVIQNAVQNPRVQNVGNQNGLIGVQGNGNQNQIGNGNLVAARAEGNAAGQNGNQIRCYNCKGVGHYARDCTVRPKRRDAAYLQTQLLIAQKEEAGIQLQVEEYDLMAAAADLDEIKEVSANCILMANSQQASTSGTQTDSAPVYDSDGSAKVYNFENCYDNEIFNMFTQEE
nr:hypothetical protein [Tanacetum cinerariifolium]